LALVVFEPLKLLFVLNLVRDVVVAAFSVAKPAAVLLAVRL